MKLSNTDNIVSFSAHIMLFTYLFRCSSGST